VLKVKTGDSVECIRGPNPPVGCREGSWPSSFPVVGRTYVVTGTRICPIQGCTPEEWGCTASHGPATLMALSGVADGDRCWCALEREYKIVNSPVPRDSLASRLETIIVED
jgi:hypothetical protein